MSCGSSKVGCTLGQVGKIILPKPVKVPRGVAF